MVDESEHGRCVDAWMERVANDLPPERLVQVFELGFCALWHRADQTLGDVTLAAIADRVLFTAAELFPDFASLKIEESGGLRCEELRERARNLQHDHLAAGIRFLLVEFLTILGNLTAEILTPALHSELSGVVPLEGEPAENAALPNPESKDGEVAKS